MLHKMREALELLNLEYITSFSIGEDSRIEDLQKAVNFPNDFCLENKVCFVYGRGRKKQYIRGTMRCSIVF